MIILLIDIYYIIISLITFVSNILESSFYSFPDLSVLLCPVLLNLFFHLRVIVCKTPSGGLLHLRDSLNHVVELILNLFFSVNFMCSFY